MKKIILFLLAILYVGICKAQLSAADCKYVLEIFWGCVISLWRTLFYVIYCIILEVS